MARFIYRLSIGLIDIDGQESPDPRATGPSKPDDQGASGKLERTQQLLDQISDSLNGADAAIAGMQSNIQQFDRAIKILEQGSQQRLELEPRIEPHRSEREASRDELSDRVRKQAPRQREPEKSQSSDRGFDLER